MASTSHSKFYSVKCKKFTILVEPAVPPTGKEECGPVWGKGTSVLGTGTPVFPWEDGDKKCKRPNGLVQQKNLLHLCSSATGSLRTAGDQHPQSGRSCTRLQRQDMVGTGLLQWARGPRGGAGHLLWGKIKVITQSHLKVYKFVMFCELKN